jgi:predicted ester cyclase
MMDRQVLPDGRFKALSITAEDDRVVLHWELTGTNSGSILGRKATGKKLRITGTEFVRIRDGKVVEHDDAGYHALEALRQLGLLETPILEEPRFKD